MAKSKQPSRGQDAVRKAVGEQRAERVQQTAFPALMATALALESLFDAPSCKAYLEKLVEEAGDPTDPIETMLLQQLGLAHFRIAQLHASAGQAQAVEAAKAYSAAAARLLGEFRRTCLALGVYRSQMPRGKASESMKVFRAAQ